MEPTAIAFVCDDYRIEINGKPFVIGLYTQGLIFDKLPAIIPQLFVWVIFVSDFDAPILKFSVEVSSPGSDISRDFDFGSAQMINHFPDATRLEISALMPIHNFEVSEPGTLTITVKFDGGEIRAKRLPILLFQPPEFDAAGTKQKAGKEAT